MQFMQLGKIRNKNKFKKITLKKQPTFFITKICILENKNYKTITKNSNEKTENNNK